MNNKFINILDLHRTLNEKNQKKIECYEKVLEICHKRIKLSNNNNSLRLVFEIPEFIYGYPLFDLNECIKYLLNNLKLNGFLVKYYFPKILYISWDFKEINMQKELIDKQNIQLEKQEKIINNRIKTEQMYSKDLLLSSLLTRKKTSGKLQLDLN